MSNLTFLSDDAEGKYVQFSDSRVNIGADGPTSRVTIVLTRAEARLLAETIIARLDAAQKKGAAA